MKILIRLSLLYSFICQHVYDSFCSDDISLATQMLNRFDLSLVVYKARSGVRSPNSNIIIIIKCWSYH